MPYLKQLQLEAFKEHQKEQQMNYQMNMLNQMNMLRDLSRRVNMDSPRDLDALMMKMALEESLKK